MSAGIERNRSESFGLERSISAGFERHLTGDHLSRPSSEPSSIGDDDLASTASQNEPLELQKKYAPEPRSKMLAEIILAVTQIALVVILVVLISQITLPLTVGFVVALKLPHFIGAGMITLTMLFGVYHFAKLAFRHMASCWQTFQTS